MERSVIHHKRGTTLEVLTHYATRRFGDADFINCGKHMPQPRIALCLPDGKRDVTYPQTWMPALLLIAVRATEVLGEKEELCLFPRFALGGKERIQQWVFLHAAVKGINEAMEGRVASHKFVHSNGSWALLMCPVSPLTRHVTPVVATDRTSLCHTLPA